MPDTDRIPVLYLIPGRLGEDAPMETVPPAVTRTIRELSWFIVEDLRSARRFLKAVDKSLDVERLHFSLLNEHTRPEELEDLLEPLRQGHDAGLLSEAGLPCVADPGSQLVSLAHRQGFTVRPLPGPSSIYLALMASGFNGQQFIFHGYLPAEKSRRAQKIREIESDMLRNDRTQLFIETPYRNRQLFESLLQTCRETTLLCIACNLSSEDEKVMVHTIGWWKENIPDLNKIPAVFLLYR